MEENKNLDKNQNDALSDDDLASVSGGGTFSDHP